MAGLIAYLSSGLSRRQWYAVCEEPGPDAHRVQPSSTPNQLSERTTQAVTPLPSSVLPWPWRSSQPLAGWFRTVHTYRTRFRQREKETLRPGSAAIAGNPNKTVGALQFLYDLIYKHKVMPEPGALKAAGVTDRMMFMTERVAMTTDALHPDAYAIFAEELGWKGFDATLVPHPKGKPLVNWAGFGGFSLSAKTKNPRAALKLVKFIASGSKVWWPNPTMKAGLTGYISTSISRFPQLKATNFAAAFKEGLETVRFSQSGHPFTISRYSDQDWAAFRDRLWMGKVSPQDLLKEVPKWNSNYVKGLEKDLREQPLKPSYKTALAKLLEEVKKR